MCNDLRLFQKIIGWKYKNFYEYDFLNSQNNSGQLFDYVTILKHIWGFDYHVVIDNFTEIFKIEQFSALIAWRIFESSCKDPNNCEILF